MLIVSIAFFWLPTLFLVDTRALVAGYLAGHLAGTTGRAWSRRGQESFRRSLKDASRSR